MAYTVKLREEDRLLADAVAAAHDQHVLAPVERPVARSAEVNACADEVLLPRERPTADTWTQEQAALRRNAPSPPAASRTTRYWPSTSRDLISADNSSAPKQRACAAIR